MPTEPSASQRRPMRQPSLYILLSLAAGEKHGYAILKDVEQVSQGRVVLGTGTLYEALSRLLDQGLIERSDERTSNNQRSEANQSHPGRPRKFYRLTQSGYRVLEAETDRLRMLVAAAQRRLGEERV